MEASVGDRYYHMGGPDLRGLGKRSLEWDVTDWKWDGDLFIATPLRQNPSNNYQSRQFFPVETGNLVASSNSSSSCSDETNHGIEQQRRELEKRRRVIVVDENDSGGTLSLKLGGQAEPVAEKRTKLAAAAAPPAPVTGTTRAVCQVDDCGTDLSKAKDYHRRHKVCEMHSKASRALVGNVMQRFCQQCSRFHALQEFDEGKRSCRRRLAGHNKRRRKTQSESVANNNSSNDGQASGYSLMSLLKMLSNMHSNGTNHTEDQDLLAHLLRSIAGQGSLNGDKSLSGLLQESSNLLNNRSILRNPELASLISNCSQAPPRAKEHQFTNSAAEMPQKRLDAHDVRLEDARTASSQSPGILFPPIQSNSQAYAQGRGSTTGRSKLIDFDLNDVYVDSDDNIEDIDRSPVQCPSWLQQDSHQSSPPQTSGNSDSASAQSPSSSSGDTQTRTDRIVFKLFGKDPSDFPFVVRAQILDWLSRSPTEIESYIRPGCVVLTVYLRLPESAWEELCYDLNSSLSRLLDVHGDDSFWTKGWIYISVQNQIAFVCDGQVLLDMSLPSGSNEHSTILSVRPIAVPVSERAQFLVKGYNLSKPSTRLLCALESNYLVPEANNEVEQHVDGIDNDDKLQSLNFTCSVPAVTGRGFIEVEDQGLSNSFFPFIVAEEDVCSEIRMLESELDLTSANYVKGQINNMEARNQAMDFIHELGWLLHRNNLKARLEHFGPDPVLYPLKRFKWLIDFCVDHEWCAVVKKLLNVLLDGTVGAGDSSFLKFALTEMGLLHRAVRRNSRPLVELLLTYSPEKVADELSSEYQSLVEIDGEFLFRPDCVGPAGLTPLHVAAGIDGSEEVLDALTDDPGKVAIEAWKNTRDSTGFTPEDYARLRGHYSYIHLVQRKISKKATSGHIVVDIPIVPSIENSNQKEEEFATNSLEISMTERRPISRPCGLCHKKLAYGSRSRSLLYRPAMFSMVAMAAVCVCVALLFRGSPEVLYIFRPFRWEMVDFGTS
ncbi:PREDICTED: squamosa promoter-binding-like protein 1 [Nicotiana attenuata]|uniref:Squamosa promoter-binding-like protein 1 n=1 Tax=Nicotiana attenuata TaxID=49451 RepID=A0A1J6IP33_NICAT|nr:PREDICTED: squamosa promoter-binding-like protein 1 [Nicotiana attenuata]OIT02312.1 squamosa promoter-binding-like protein 1 [Nicotiana attenuata]